MLIVLDQTSPLPFYRQIVEQVRTKILAGEVRAGDGLPSIRQLAVELVISVITVKRAYQELEAAGLIVTRQGIGTFVADLGSVTTRQLSLDEVGGRLREVRDQAARLGLSPGELRELVERVIAEGEKRK